MAGAGSGRVVAAGCFLEINELIKQINGMKPQKKSEVINLQRQDDPTNHMH